MGVCSPLPRCPSIPFQDPMGTYRLTLWPGPALATLLLFPRNVLTTPGDLLVRWEDVSVPEPLLVAIAQVIFQHFAIIDIDLMQHSAKTGTHAIGPDSHVWEAPISDRPVRDGPVSAGGADAVPLLLPPPIPVLPTRLLAGKADQRLASPHCCASHC